MERMMIGRDLLRLITIAFQSSAQNLFHVYSPNGLLGTSKKEVNEIIIYLDGPFRLEERLELYL